MKICDAGPNHLNGVGLSWERPRLSLGGVARWRRRDVVQVCSIMVLLVLGCRRGRRVVCVLQLGPCVLLMVRVLRGRRRVLLGRRALRMVHLRGGMGQGERGGLLERVWLSRNRVVAGQVGVLVLVGKESTAVAAEHVACAAIVNKAVATTIAIATKDIAKWATVSIWSKKVVII